MTPLIEIKTQGERFSAEQVNQLCETINETRERNGLPPIDDAKPASQISTVWQLQKIAAASGASLAEVTRAFESLGRAFGDATDAVEAFEDEGETDRNRRPSKDGGWASAKPEPKPEQGRGALAKFFWAVLASMAGTAIYILLQGGAI
jgi:hypothetical protein